MQHIETVRNRLTRQEIAEKLAEYEKSIIAYPSQRQSAKEIGIPRSTLQHWLKRKDSVDADPDVAAFFESPAGTAFMHRLVLGAHFVMTLIAPASVRHVCQYLELTGLDQFVASSYFSNQKVSKQMEEATAEFGREERKRLAEGTEPKKISVCQDETFHPETCLVAIEPVSNFILLEKYSDGRSSEDWTKAMNEATEGLPTEIVQSVSDEGRGIVHHVKNELGAHHSSDVFHVQHEVVKGTGGALAGKTARAGKSLEKASEEVSRHIKEKDAYFGRKHGPGRPPDFDRRIEKAREKEAEARKSLETAAEHQNRVKDAVQGISDAYHPFDLDTGSLRSAEEVSSSLNRQFSEIEAAASESGLSDRCVSRIKKAKKVAVSMVATVVFFLSTIRAKMEALSLTPEAEQAVYENLIPAIYMRLVSDKAGSSEKRHYLRKKSQEPLSPLLAGDGPFSGLEPEEKLVVERVSEECAQLFQRSSSCVEGRNGQLSLRHHSLHRISDRKLSALTTVHNFVVKNSDKTTAAERFFGSKPGDLFEFLLNKVELPGRPAQKRFQPKKEGYLQVA